MRERERGREIRTTYERDGWSGEREIEWREKLLEVFFLHVSYPETCYSRHFSPCLLSMWKI